MLDKHRSRAVLVVLACLAVPGSAAAFRADLDARTSAWLYPVVGRDGLVVSDEFLFQTRLRVRLDDILPLDPDGPAPMDAPDVAVAGSLRWFYDFGVGDVSDPSNLGYVPMLDTTTLDLLFLYVEARNLLDGVLDARVGRLIHSGALGWRSDDGAMVRAGYEEWVHVQLIGGIENVRGLWFSASPFAPDGIERWDETGTGADRYRDPGAPTTVRYRPMFQGSVDGTIGPVGYDIGYRHTWKSLDGGTAESLLGMEVDVAEGPASGLGSVRLDLATLVVAEALAEAGVRLGDGSHRIELSYEYFQPTFDLDSIFWVFASDPFHEVTATYRFPLPGPLSGHVWTSLRRVEDRDDEGDAEPVLGPFSDLGGGLGLALRLSRLTASARWKVLRGTATSLAAFDLSARVTIDSSWNAYAVASVWQYEDRPRADYHGIGAAGRLGTRYQFLPEVAVEGEFQTANDPREGTTFAGFVWLDLGVTL